MRPAGAAGSSSYASVVLADSPVGYWRFGEAAGSSTAADASGHGITGTYEGGTLGVAGALFGDSDTAVHFDGAAGDRVTFGDNFDMTGTQPFSLELWVKPDVVPSGYAVLASKFNAGPELNGYALTLNQTYGFALDRWANGVHGGSVSYGHVVAGRWYHVVASYDGSTSRLYVDGRLGIPKTDTASIADESGAFSVGDTAADTTGSDAFEGTVDEAAVYAYALPAARIRVHYFTGASPAGSPYGAQKRFTFVSQRLDDRLGLSVNVGNGNLLLRQSDLHEHGVAGLDLDIGRVYNSLQPGFGALAPGWQLTLGGDVGVIPLDDGSVGYDSPDGARYVFVKSGSGWTSPQGLDATLTQGASGDYLVTGNLGGVRLVFDASGRLIRVASRNDADAHPVRIGFSYDQDGHLDGITDSHGHPITVGLFEGYVVEFEDALRYVTYGHTSDWNLSDLRDAAGNQTSYGYDSNNALTSITTPAGNKTTIAYDADGRVAEVTRVTDSSSGSGPTMSFAYGQTNANCPSGTTATTETLEHPDGSTIETNSFCIGARERVQKTLDGLGRSTSSDFTPGSGNGDDNPAGSTNQAGGLTSFSYSSDGRNNLIETQGPVDPNGLRATSTYSYLSSNNPFAPSRLDDADGNRFNYAYDASGNLCAKSEQQASDPLSCAPPRDGSQGQHPVVFARNSLGQITTATDGRGNQTSYGYDPTSHDLTSIAPPAPLGAVHATYDTLDRLATVTDGKGQTRSYSYDNLDRVTQVVYKNSSGSVVETRSYSYDADGNTLSRSDASGQESYGYDALNRITSASGPTGSIAYGWDDASRLASLDDSGSGASTVSYSYDQANRLTAIGLPVGWGGGTIGYSYPDEQHTTISYPNGASLASSYDTAKRLTRIVGKGGAGTSVSDLAYSYEYASGGADGTLRRSLTDNLTGITTSYGYDPVGRLAAATASSGPSYSYDYDANGNLTSETINGTTTGYSYNAANELAGAADGYDQNGNQTSDSAFGAVYNPEDQTTTLTPTGGSSLSLTYSGPGQAERLTAQASSDTQTFTSDLLGIGAVDSSQHGQTTLIRQPDGTVIGQHQPAGSSYFLLDALDSVIAVTDPNGNLSRSFSYGPYGNQTASTGTTFEPIRYANGYHDQQTGLEKFGDRYYNPTTSRWTQPDPLTNPLNTHGWNPYTYAGDNPINYVDPTGTFPGFDDILDLFGNNAQLAVGCYYGAETGALIGLFTAPQFGGEIVGALAGCVVGMTVAEYNINEPVLGD